MRIAIEEARQALAEDEVPVGAVIVCQDQVIARAHNHREAWQDPTAHAELLAIKQAANVLGTWRLLDASLYVTLEPCAMCAGAIVLARIKTLVFGARDPKAGATGSVLNIVQHSALNHEVEIVEGILKDECSEMLQSFFKKIRQRNKKK